MKYGYARVSTIDQNLDRQIQALDNAGVDEIISESASGAGHRPELEDLLHRLKAGDLLIVTRLARLGRSTKNLFEILDMLRVNNIDILTLDSGEVDTTTAQGKMLWSMIAIFAEFERDLIRERTIEGMRAAKSRGKNIGRPKISQNIKQKVMRMKKGKKYSMNQIAEECGISRATVYNIIKEFQKIYHN